MTESINGIHMTMKKRFGAGYIKSGEATELQTTSFQVPVLLVISFAMRS